MIPPRGAARILHLRGDVGLVEHVGRERLQAQFLRCGIAVRRRSVTVRDGTVVAAYGNGVDSCSSM